MFKQLHRSILPLCLLSTSLSASPTELPSSAIPGLRYYYPPEKVEPRQIETDICIYGGTSGGVAAAVQAARMGKKVVLLEFGKHVGGLTSGGLNDTDGGAPEVCGGIAREFYNQVGQSTFNPHEAEQTYLDMLKSAGVKVHLLAQLTQVDKVGPSIQSITMEDGLTVRAQQFIDCTYEGDLMAMAGVSFAVGREGNSMYGETYNGILTPGEGGHDFLVDIDPYQIPGNPESGLLPRINKDWGTTGEGDDRIQAYCFRMWLTQDNPLPFPKPPVYEAAQYEILARLFESEANPRIRFRQDTNNHHLFEGAYFIDYVGGADLWPDGDYQTRERLFQEHLNYQLGVMWFLQNSDRIPEKHQQVFKSWGLPRNIYKDTGGWTHQLYIREGRRMVSDYVMTEHNCMHREVPEDSIGLATYRMDSHHCQMTVVDGFIRNEGNIEIAPAGPYPIPYRAITPEASECTNLLVPWSLSASHIAFGSIRMEPVFMVLGQSAATAAAFAIDDGVSVQNVSYPKLKKQLLADGQKLFVEVK